MPTATPSRINPSPIDLNESVKSVLAQKPPALWSISPDSSVFEAIELMSARRVGALVVLSSGGLAGIISERDYARKVILKGRQSRETRVREIMTAPALFVTPQQTIGECMHIMTSRQIRHLPVLDGERVIGMLSIGDVVNWIISAQDDTIRHLKNYIAGAYPG